VIPLTDNIGFITALANDEGYESIFEQQLRNLGREGDLLVAISGSGNYAQRAACGRVRALDRHDHDRRHGFDGGKLARSRARACTCRSTTWACARAVHGVVFHAAMCFLRERLAQHG
jgi:D-sedoheptulose 7-phosphate isomerase